MEGKRSFGETEAENAGSQESSGGSLIVAKKQKTELMTRIETSTTLTTQSGPPRTSNLFSPIMLLSGHQGEVFSTKFSPDGQNIASSSFDKQIFVWRTYGECENYMVLKGHTNAVLDVHWSSDGKLLFSSSADKTIAIWDAETGERVKKLRGHSNVVNTLAPSKKGPPILASAGDDSTIKVWDLRVRACVQQFSNNAFPVLATCFSDNSDQIFAGGIDNDIKGFDLRKKGVSLVLRGHEDSVTGLALSPEGSYILSNGMDCVLRVWDIRPYAPQERCLKTFQGAQHNFEKNILRCCWSPDGSKVSAGSADRFVYIWDTTTRKIIYKLPGHAGSVNETQFHPEEPIIASCSSDKNIYLGEFHPNSFV